MAPSNLGYSLREAFSHFGRNWTTSVGAVITIFLSLFIIGLFIIGSAMITSAIGTIEDSVTINAFISDEASDEDVEAFRATLESWDNVANVDFRSKDEALEAWQGMTDNADSTLSALDGENPLPRSFVIEMEDSSQVEAMAQQIKDDPGFQAIADGGDVENVPPTEDEEFTFDDTTPQGEKPDNPDTGVGLEGAGAIGAFAAAAAAGVILAAKNKKKSEEEE